MLFYLVIMQRAAAENILKALQEHQDSWQKVDAILETSTNQQTKFFALQVSRVTLNSCAVVLLDIQKDWYIATAACALSASGTAATLPYESQT